MKAVALSRNVAVSLAAASNDPLAPADTIAVYSIFYPQRRRYMRR